MQRPSNEDYFGTMNIFYINFSGALARVPEYLGKKHTSRNVHMVVNSDKEVRVQCRNSMIYRDCILGRFGDIDKYSEYPIDSSLLNGLCECESDVLKMMDRYQFAYGLLTYEARINLYHKQLKYWYNYLLQENIDVCFFAVIPHVIFDYIIYCLCKHLNIRTILLYRTTILLNKNISVYILNDIEKHICRLAECYRYHLANPDKTKLSERMLAYFDLKYGNKEKTFTGVEIKKRDLKKYLSPERYIKSLSHRIAFARSWMKLWGRPLDLLYRFIYKISFLSQSKPIFQNNPDFNRRFIYVALHYQPECSTSPMGGSFVHQDLMIDILMKSVPKDIMIYVKAHLRDGMSRMLFKRIRADDRTVLIDPSLNSFDLITKSVAVATITGTSGWEAFLNNKPVLMFGNYFYQDAPGVFKIKTVKDSVSAISMMLDGKCVISDDMIVAFLKAVDENSFPGWVDNRYAPMSRLTEDENCRNIAEHLAAELMCV